MKDYKKHYKMLSFHFVVFFSLNLSSLLLTKYVIERLVVLHVEWGAIYCKFDDVEVLGVFFEGVGVCAGDYCGVVLERAASKCAKYQYVNSLSGGNIQDVLCA